jgi:hypothetical protein
MTGKWNVYVGLFCVCIASGALAQAGGGNFAVQITDMSRSISYEVLPADEWKALQEKNRFQAEYFVKAMNLAMQEWKEDNTLKNYSFPSSALSAPKAASLGEFDSEDKANEKIAPLRKKQEVAAPAVKEEQPLENPEVKKEPKKKDVKPKKGAKKEKEPPRKLEPAELVQKACVIIEMKFDALKVEADAKGKK